MHEMSDISIQDNAKEMCKVSNKNISLYRKIQKINLKQVAEKGN